MTFITTNPTYIDKTYGTVIQLRMDECAMTQEILNPWLDEECFPEGVHDILLNINSSWIPNYSIGDAQEWSDIAHEPGVCVQQLFLYDHSGLSLSTAPQCSWDTSAVGIIGVKADTTEHAEKYLNQIVKVWDDFLQFGSVDAIVYASLAKLLDGGDYDDIFTVTPSLTPEEQVKEAASYFSLQENMEWVPLKDAGSVVLKAIQDVVTAKNVDDMGDAEVQEALSTIKDWAAVINTED